MDYLDTQRRLLVKLDEAIDGLESGTMTIRRACEHTGFIHGGTREYLIRRLKSRRVLVLRTIVSLSSI